MVEGLLGRKVGMTQVFTDDGVQEPVTVIEAGPCPVVSRRTAERDGYDAVQLGFGEKKRPNNPTRGHFAKAKVEPTRVLKEFRGDDLDALEVGSIVGVDIFAEGDVVDVQGVTKGKGFQGVIKRHGFSRGPETHGSHHHRAPGSIGQCKFPGHVFKGRKLPGRMGAVTATVQRLRVVRVEPERNLLLVRGAVPGPRDGIITIRRTRKRRKYDSKAA